MDITLWYTTVEATAILGKGEKWLRDNYKKHDIERIVRGHTAFYSKADIDRLAVALRRPTGPNYERDEGEG